MAKNAVSDWSTTASDNTDIGGITIAEGCAMANLNNGMREMMAQIASGVVVKVAATATVAAYFQLAEATNNGTHKLTFTPPTSLTADRTLTAPDASGTIALLDAVAGSMYGLTLSNGSDATNDIDIAAGVAMDSTNVRFIKLASGITKQLDAAWAVGTNQGGLDTGVIANTTYHLWLIMRSDTGVVDVLFSASASSPTMPANYDYKRYLRPIIRAGGTIVAFVQNGNTFNLAVPVQDYTSTNPGTSALTVTLPSVPTGVAVSAIISASIQDASASVAVYGLMTPLSTTNTAASSTIHNVSTSGTGGGVAMNGAASMQVITNTSAQIRGRLSSSDADITLRVVTFGWVHTPQ